MELKDLLAVAWKRRAAVLAVFALTMAFAALFAFSQPKRYESTAMLAMTPDIKEGQGLFAADNLSALLGTYAETAKSTITLRRAERTLGRPLNAEIDASTEAGTGILRISALLGEPAGRVDGRAGDRHRVLRLDRREPVARRDAGRPAGALHLAGAAAAAADPARRRRCWAGSPACCWPSALENFRRRIETPADIAEHTPAPVIGRLPRQRSLSRANSPQIIWEQENAVGLQESYRALRTNLEFLLEDRSRVLEVTSPDPAQGKSTLVANLAIAFGQIGVETVIVDADLRRPRQHDIFGLDNTEGLSSIMALGGEPPLKPSGYPNLWVLTSGPGAAGPDRDAAHPLRQRGRVAALDGDAGADRHAAGAAGLRRAADRPARRRRRARGHRGHAAPGGPAEHAGQAGARRRAAARPRAQHGRQRARRLRRLLRVRGARRRTTTPAKVPRRPRIEAR